MYRHKATAECVRVEVIALTYRYLHTKEVFTWNGRRTSNQICQRCS